MSNEAVVFSGPDQVQVYQILVVAKALEFYAKHKMQVNRAYTPSAMLRTATFLTGKAFKRGQYVEAAMALRAMLPQPAAA